MSNEMTSRVLILSAPDDAHALAVSAQLKRFEADVFFWQMNQFIDHTRMNFAVGLNSGQFVSDSGDSFDLFSFDAIWFRRPGRIKAKKFFQPWITDMIEVEARHALLGMLYSLPCTWVNYPARDTAASLKLFQLQIAKSVGIKIPETLITNESGVAKSFYEKFDGNVIYKLVTEVSNFSLPPYEFPHGIPTLPLRSSDLEHLAQVQHSPHLFQEKVDKQCDIRVTIIGKRIFAFKIDSQKGDGKVDWRTDYTVPMTPWNLPNALSTKCLNLMHRLGLNYGAMDFCVDQGGEYIFLEVNPAGQYLWLEERTQQPMSQELASLLVGQSEPLVSYAEAAFAEKI